MTRLVIVRSERAAVAPSAMLDAPDAVRTALLALARQGDNEGQVAASALALWRRIEVELSPVLGPGGVAALYRRSLHRAGAQHAALAGVHAATAQVDDFDPFHRALACLSHTDAVATSRSLMQAFCELLTGLIGDALTERLLKPAARPLPKRLTTKDTPP